MIENIDNFIKAVFDIGQAVSIGSIISGGGGGPYFIVNMNKDCNGNTYCPKCGGERRFAIELLYIHPTVSGFLNLVRAASSYEEGYQNIKKHLAPSLWKFVCNQCDMNYVVTFYEKNNQIEMAMLPSCDGGVVTKNTPHEVAYYIDQAYRAKSVGANSACIAMYRAALDQLLHQQGYTSGMLGNKLSNLEADIKAEKAPVWAKDLDINYLSYLNSLGSGSIHPNDGDIKKQKELDNQLLEVVDVVFAMLLDLIYEKPTRELGWLNALEEKSKHFSWKKK